MAQSWVRTATLVVMCGAAALPGMAADSLTTPPRQTELPALAAGNTQQISSPDPQAGTITGTVMDVNGDAVPGATIVLEGPSVSDHPTVVANDSGYFQLKNLNPGVTYHIVVTANGFADWTSPDIILQPGQVQDLPAVNLEIATVVTTVKAVSSDQVAIEQVRMEETQRVLGVIPNFYVAYDHNAAPLTSKLKFQLALKTSVDPVTFFGVGMLAGINQAADTPNYVQGAKGYGERFGAAFIDLNKHHLRFDLICVPHRFSIQSASSAEGLR